MVNLIRKYISSLIVAIMTITLGVMIGLAIFIDKPPISVPAQQFPQSAFEAAKNPLSKFAFPLKNQAKDSRKIYKSIVPLRADGRYEIKGGELDWHSFTFYGKDDLSGNEYQGVSDDVKPPSDFPIDAAELAVKYFNNQKSGCYALYDLNANGVDEIIIQSGSASSGMQYLILENQQKKWKVIDEFAGGFLLTSLDLIESKNKKYSSDYWHLVHWWSSGNDFVQVLHAYQSGEYKEVSSQNVPYAIRELDFGKLDLDANC